MDWSNLAIHFSCSRLDGALEEFTKVTLCGLRLRALALQKDLRASRATLQSLGRVQAVDCVCTETSEARSVTTPLHNDAARRVTEQLRRRVRKYRTAVAEEYRTLVPTEREAFEKGFDVFVEQCLQNEKNKTESWFKDLVSSGAIEPHLRHIYITFQLKLREECTEAARTPLPPPLFRMEPSSTALIEQEQEPKQQVLTTQRRSKSLTHVSAPHGYGPDNHILFPLNAEEQEVDYSWLPSQSSASEMRLEEIQIAQASSFSSFSSSSSKQQQRYYHHRHDCHDQVRHQSFPGFLSHHSNERRESYDHSIHQPGVDSTLPVNLHGSQDHKYRILEDVERAGAIKRSVKTPGKKTKSVSFSKDVKFN